LPGPRPIELVGFERKTDDCCRRYEKRTLLEENGRSHRGRY